VITCYQCEGTGINRHSGHLCPHCEGSGYMNWFFPLVVAVGALTCSAIVLYGVELVARWARTL